MNVICLEEKAFYELVEQVVERLREKHNVPLERWIDSDEAMKLLRISSHTTLLKYRNEGKIKFSQPGGKIVLYDRQSIDDFLESKASKTF